jgi:hypothetical protein
LFQGSVHLLESAPRLLKNATDKRNEDAFERLALNEERPAVSRLKFEMMLAVEDAGEHQTAEPGEFLIRLCLQDGRLHRYRSPIGWLQPDLELRPYGGLTADPPNERIPLRIRIEVREYGPNSLRRRRDLDLGA